MKLYFDEGVRKVEDDYIFDYTNDLKSDIIDLTSVQLYKKSHFDNVYWFGYTFTDTASSAARSDFIDRIKGLSSSKINDNDLNTFIIRPLRKFEQAVDLSEISCIIYPRSNRSGLVKNIMTCISEVFPHNTSGITFEAIKNLPRNIGFDCDRFLNEFNGDSNALSQIKNYIDNELLPKIHQLDYFSIAKNAKPKYRPYIQNYLILNDFVKKSLNLLEDGKILIVDDILTSGASVNEIIKQIRSLNTSNEIYIFTLIGK